MKRTIALVSLAGVLAVAALAQASSVTKGANCKDCPADHCPFCPPGK